MKFDYIIVGAGLSGCVVAEQLSKSENKKILIVEKRNHIAGNCYDFRDENNILIHKYGPHIFHTNNEKVWNYLSEFTEWEKYQHRVLANIDGILTPVPFNLNSIHKCFPATVAQKLETKLIEKYQYGTKIPILQLKKENDELLKMLADFIYEKVFLNYTVKQWNLKPEELDETVTARIPVFISRDDRYFQDKYQGIPKLGYSKLVEKMIDKPNIHLLLNTDFFAIKNDLQYEKLIFTGKIDEYFAFEFGKLPYRSLLFEFEKFELPNFQKNYQTVAQINYPNEYNFTRITEFIHFFAHQNFHNKTVIAREFPTSYSGNSNEIPYYPIPQKANNELAEKYKNCAKELSDVVFLGRLADYKYYNMDQVVERALELSHFLP